jgi:hypothetical protein
MGQRIVHGIQAMAESISQRRNGIALVLAAAVAWSTAPFFTRLLLSTPGPSCSGAGCSPAA